MPGCGGPVIQPGAEERPESAQLRHDSVRFIRHGRNPQREALMFDIIRPHANHSMEKSDRLCIRQGGSPFTFLSVALDHRKYV